MRGLLAEQGEGDPFYQEVVSVCICLAESEDALDGYFPVQLIEHPVGFLEQLHGLCSLGTLFFGKGGEPGGTASIAAMNIGYGCETWLKAPGMKEVNPVDIRTYLTDRIVKNHRLGIYH